MTQSSHDDITSLIAAAGSGDSQANDALYDIVYEELRHIARAQRSRWHGDETLGTTALIHEAYIKLAGTLDRYENRMHFYATASRAMRHVFINYAERRQAAKRSGERIAIDPDQLPLAEDRTLEEIVELDALLDRLHDEDPRRARIVECRIFGGMSIVDTAAALDVSPATVKRDWQVASAWLYSELRHG